MTLETLVENKEVNAWRPTALYLDDNDAPIGARLVHVYTGFTLDYLRIESAPQGFIWVTTFPTSDKGEPHTQEHLLLGKGDHGRKLGSMEAMALAHSSAFTQQWRTAYHFHTVAGVDVFWPVFETQLDALLHPDYTDEEIRREVRNFGVDKRADGSLALEEKGTVYNEMVRAYEAPETGLYRVANQLTYGAQHPLAFDSGGYPAAIREMTPEDIRKFHKRTYHLANMGMVLAFPKAVPLDDVLAKAAKVLDKNAGPRGVVGNEADLPKPAAAKPGEIVVVNYPYGDNTNPGPALFAWPATRNLDESDRILLGLFLDAFAGDDSTTLYKALIDSRTRTLDIGATGLGTEVTRDQGQPVHLQITGVKPDKLDAATLGQVRQLILDQLDRIAKLPEGDAELVAFDQRVASRIVDFRRRMVKFLDTPPGFGTRGIDQDWIAHLHQLDKAGDWKKSLTEKPALAKAEQVLVAKGNPWKDRLKTWGLLEAPYVVASKPSQELRQKLDAERAKRIEEELARLAKEYATKTPAETLAKYQTAYDAETQKIEAASKAVQLPPLVPTPPMTLDDGLAYSQDAIGNAPALRARIDTMASSRAGLAFRLDGVDADKRMFLALMPALLSQVGVVDGSKPIASDEMKERLRKEILALSVRFDEDLGAGRVELVVEGAGNSVAETQAAIAWMGRALFAPDWRSENLARLRDVVDQAATSLRQTMLGAEETWVQDPRAAWWRQAWPLHAHTSAFLTRAHDVHRLRWMLEDPGDPKVQAEVVAWFGQLAEARTLPRAKLVALAKSLEQLPEPPKPAAPAPAAPAAGSGSAGSGSAAPKAPPPATAPAAPADPALARWTTATAALSPAAKAVARHAGKDLGQLLGDLPDSSLGNDWAYLCKQMAKDLGDGAAKALAALDDTRKQILAGRVRAYTVGSTKAEAAIVPELAKLVGKLPADKVSHEDTTGPRYIAERLAGRDPSAKTPMFVGLVAPGTSSGVFLNTAAAPSYAADSDEAILDYLTSNLYTGHGAHSLFSKTWGAGLAYSNGVHPFVRVGMQEWYAERCPSLPQTLRFVTETLNAAKPDANIARYALATTFTSRVADSYESRAANMAADFADGVTPQKVKAFRARMLDASKKPDFADKLFARMPAVYGNVVPGYGKPSTEDRFSFVIGPDKQLAQYQEYLKTAIAKDTVLYKLYPRDFWIVATGI